MKSFFRAQEQSRTATPFLALPPESSASTNFATCASELECKYTKYFYTPHRNSIFFIFIFNFRQFIHRSSYLLYGDIELKDLLPVADTEGYPCPDVVYDNADVIKFLGGPVVA